MGANESMEEIIAMENYQWYAKFMKECPSGQVTIYECKKILGLENSTALANNYVEKVFNIFDTNKIAKYDSLGLIIFSSSKVGPTLTEPALLVYELNIYNFAEVTGSRLQAVLCSKPMDGFIDFLELIAAINLLIRGKIDQKLKWYFKLYDIDGSGTIDRKEVISILMAIQTINNNQEMTPEELTNLIFQKIDVNNDGELTLEELMNGVEKDEHFREIISKSFELSNVLKIIHSDRRQSV